MDYTSLCDKANDVIMYLVNFFIYHMTLSGGAGRSKLLDVYISCILTAALNCVVIMFLLYILVRKLYVVLSCM